MEEQERGAMRPPAISSLLADLASHHERLNQASRELGEAIVAACEAAGWPREAPGEEGPAAAPAAVALMEEVAEDADGRGAPGGLSSSEDEVAGVRSEVPSEWHRKLLESDPRMHVSEVREINKMKASLPKANWTSDDHQGDEGFSGNLMPGEIVSRMSGEIIARTGQDGEDDTFDEDFATLPPPRLSDRSLQQDDDDDVDDDEVWDGHVNIVRRCAVMRMQKRLGKTNLRGEVDVTQVYCALVKVKLYCYHPEDIEKWMRWLKKCHAQMQRHHSWARHHSWTMCFNSRLRDTALSARHESQYAVPETSMDFRSFVEVLLDEEILCLLPSDLHRMSRTIREILFCGDANRLVADLTRVRIEEVAAPSETADAITRLEPIIGMMIVLNGIFIGIQSSVSITEGGGGGGWFWGNCFFSTVMVAEVILRITYKGCKSFMHSLDRWWNCFDCIMIIIALCDLILDAMTVNKVSWMQFSVMRIMRLTRLTRLVRIFRLRFLKELNLMIRGLFGGLRTLFWAIILLFFTLYVIAVFLTTLIGGDHASVPEVAGDELFSSVPRSVLTSFRCFMGDCTTSGGKPVIKLMSDAYGPAFVFSYFASTLFIVFGLFNLIIAVYVENTMSAAKTEGEKTTLERHRDAIRIAKQTRQLLKKFCTVKRVWSTSSAVGHLGSTSSQAGEPGIKETIKAMRASMIDDIGDVSMEVSKDMYLCAIQDSAVQKLMDDMEIPAERAHLFDILDADCSGGLEVSELITGLLRVRGEAKKSDVVGTLLAVRTMQNMIRDLHDRLDTGGIVDHPPAPEVPALMDARRSMERRKVFQNNRSNGSPEVDRNSRRPPPQLSQGPT